MGIVAFEALTGKLPFTSDNVGDILELASAGDLLRPSSVADVSPDFDAWFAMATAYEPKARFASAKECAAALKSCLLE